MIIDIIVVLILVICVAGGIRKGFVFTFIHALRWIIALAAAFIFAGPLSDVLKEGSLGQGIKDNVGSGMTDASGDLMAGMPDMLRGGLTAGTAEATDMLSSMVSSLVVTVISFLIILAASALLIWILVRPLDRRHDPALIRFTDRFLGIIAGLLKGVICVFILMSILFVIINGGWGGASDILTEMMEGSYISRALYDNNLLLLVTGGFFGQ